MKCKDIFSVSDRKVGSATQKLERNLTSLLLHTSDYILHTPPIFQISISLWPNIVGTIIAELDDDNICKSSLISIPHICQFWYNATLFRLIKSTQKRAGRPGQTRPLTWINMALSWEKICKLIFFQIPFGIWWPGVSILPYLGISIPKQKLPILVDFIKNWVHFIKKLRCDKFGNWSISTRGLLPSKNDEFHETRGLLPSKNDEFHENAHFL